MSIPKPFSYSILITAYSAALLTIAGCSENVWDAADATVQSSDKVLVIQTQSPDSANTQNGGQTDVQITDEGVIVVGLDGVSASVNGNSVVVNENGVLVNTDSGDAVDTFGISVRSGTAGHSVDAGPAGIAVKTEGGTVSVDETGVTIIDNDGNDSEGTTSVTTEGITLDGVELEEIIIDTLNDSLNGFF